MTLLLCLALAQEVDFDREVRPLLEKRCLSCHGTEKRKGGLLLTARAHALLRGDSGEPAIVPGEPGKSELIKRILPISDDRMPPKGEPLSDVEIALLRRWVAQGAVWPDRDGPPRHWAYVPPVRPAPPPVRDAAWPKNEVDRFILARLEAAGLKPSPPADPARLLRRVSLDLTGLPPAVEDVDAFAEDPSDAAYERAVDRLLASPRFGEHWARPWLDLARYADSNGYQADQLRESWAYRDWVIRALNADMPFDRFTIEQLAGDLLPGATPEQRVATGFNRATTCNVEAGVDPEENRVNQVMDRVNTTATVWLGTTLECAQCHNHKYDPFSQEEYYRLYAYFNNTPVEVKQKAGVTYDFVGPTMTLALPDERRARWEELGKAIEALEKRRATHKGAGATAVPSGPARWRPLEVVAFESTGGEAHEVLDDRSVLVKGTVPGTTTYTVTLRAGLKDVRALRLETLTHPSLPGTGPGRGDDLRPNFVLNEVSVRAGDRAVALHGARADFSQKNWDVAGAVDGLPKTGWAIAEEFRKPHWAAFLLREPLDAETLTVVLDQSYGRGRTIGRLRISAWTGPTELLDLPEDLQAVAAKPKRTKEEQARLDAHRAKADPELARLDAELAALKRERAALQPPTTLVMVEMSAPRETALMKRGNFLDRGPATPPGTPAVLHPAPPDAPPNRLGLAQWLVDRRNPLVARVTVNRFWAQIFGRGLVPTLEDFGTQGERPSHPGLLDLLAVDFMDGGWSTKRLLRTIVLSAAYRQSSRLPPDADPENVLLARAPRHRLEAEVLRDNALAVAGLLSDRMHGPPIMPYQPPGLWRTVGRNEPKWIEATDEDRFRRGVYVVWRRAAPYPSFITFDAPDRASCTVKRSRTNTPLQALTLLNDPAYAEAALGLAARILTDGPADDPSRAAWAFRRCTARPPSTAELEILLSVFREAKAAYAAKPAQAKKRIESPHVPLPKGDPATLAAWADVANLLLNLDETITR